MLSRKEKVLLNFILNNCKEKNSCLLSPDELIHAMEPKYSCNQIEIDAFLDGLSQENYISVVNSDKKGNLIYCITILNKGKSFIREEKNAKKGVANAVVRTILLAILSFIVGIILKAIFK